MHGTEDWVPRFGFWTKGTVVDEERGELYRERKFLFLCKNWVRSRVAVHFSFQSG